MSGITQNIYELLFQHDCVIIPDFGGFVANYIPATIDESSNLLYPPKKHLLFNNSLISNDGLLAHLISSTNDISYDEALQKLKLYTDNLEKELAVDKRVELDGIGVIYLKDNNYQFKSEGTNFLISSFGLPVITAIPYCLEDKDEPEKETPVIDISQVSKDTNIGNKKHWWVAAVLLPIIFYSAWLPLKTNLFSNKGEFHYSDLNPFSYEKESIYECNTLVSCISSINNYNGNLDNSIINKSSNGIYGDYPIDDSEVLIKVLLQEEIEPMKPISTYVEPEVKKEISEEISSNHTGYFVVGGCFKKKSNAKKFLKKLKALGYNALEVDVHNELHRIALGVYTSRKKAKEARKEILKKDGISSWVLNKQ